MCRSRTNHATTRGARTTLIAELDRARALGSAPRRRCGSAITRPTPPRRPTAGRSTRGSPTKARRTGVPDAPAVPAEAAGGGIRSLDPGAPVEGAGRGGVRPRGGRRASRATPPSAPTATRTTSPSSSSRSATRSARLPGSATSRRPAGSSPRWAQGREQLADRLNRADASLGAVLGWVLSDDGRAEARADHRRGARGALGRVRRRARRRPRAGCRLPRRSRHRRRAADEPRDAAARRGALRARRHPARLSRAGSASSSWRRATTCCAADSRRSTSTWPSFSPCSTRRRVRSPILRAEPVAAGLERFTVPVADFALFVARPTASAPVSMPIDGCRDRARDGGRDDRDAAASGTTASLRPGAAVLVTPDEGSAALRAARARSSSPSRVADGRFERTVITVRHAVGAS